MSSISSEPCCMYLYAVHWYWNEGLIYYDYLKRSTRDPFVASKLKMRHGELELDKLYLLARLIT
jgi:hypothetical protein